MDLRLIQNVLAGRSEIAQWQVTERRSRRFERYLTFLKPESEREAVHSRVLQAPARLVFEAWSRPEHIRRWFGPVGWPVTMCEMDFRVGGR